MKKNILTLVLLGTLATAGAYAQTPASTTTTAPVTKKGDKDNFKEMDKDNDGKLSKAEVDASDRKHLKKNFAAIDTNTDGFLTKDEVKAYKATKPVKDKKN